MSESPFDYEPGVLQVFQSKVETKWFYNKIAKVYDLLAERTEQPMREAGLTVFAAAPGETILEVGCGTGHCLVELARAVGAHGKAFGVDISENMLDETRKRLTHEQLLDRVELICCDAAKLPFADATLDAVFTSFTLELFDTPELPQVLSEWQRVLKPGGRLVVIAISKEAPSGGVLKALEWMQRHFPNLIDCRPIYVRRALEAAGFSIEGARMETRWVPVEIVRGAKVAASFHFQNFAGGRHLDLLNFALPCLAFDLVGVFVVVFEFPGAIELYVRQFLLCGLHRRFGNLVKCNRFRLIIKGCFAAPKRKERQKADCKNRHPHV